MLKIPKKNAQIENNFSSIRNQNNPNEFKFLKK